MTGLKDLFRLHFVQKNDDTYRFLCKINAEHPIFASHFPQMPIVPGVCLLNAIKRSVEESCGQRLSFPKIRECKFLSPINPTQHASFDIEFAFAGKYEIRAAIFTGATQCMKLKATLSFCDE